MTCGLQTTKEERRRNGEDFFSGDDASRLPAIVTKRDGDAVSCRHKKLSRPGLSADWKGGEGRHLRARKGGEENDESFLFPETASYYEKGERVPLLLVCTFLLRLYYVYYYHYGRLLAGWRRAGRRKKREAGGPFLLSLPTLPPTQPNPPSSRILRMLKSVAIHSNFPANLRRDFGQQFYLASSGNLTTHERLLSAHAIFSIVYARLQF